jgi:hypothetical protein
VLKGSAAVRLRMNFSLNESFLRIVSAGSTCGSGTSSLSAWLEESFGKFSIYVDYNDLRDLNTGFDSVSSPPCYPVVTVTVLADHVISNDVVVFSPEV